jgi:hypothetical protein
VRIHLTAEHATEFQPAHDGFELRQFFLDFGNSLRVVFRLRQFQQFERILQARPRYIEMFQIGREARTFLAQLLRLFWLVPDVGQFKLQIYFFKALFLAVVVKETPEAKRRARTGREGFS